MAGVIAKTLKVLPDRGMSEEELISIMERFRDDDEARGARRCLASPLAYRS